MLIRIRRRHRRPLAAAALAAVALGGGLGVYMGRAHAPHSSSVFILAVDRTTSVGSNPSWPSQVGSVAAQALTAAYRGHYARFVIMGIGSDMADAAEVASADLNQSCPNPAVCSDERAAVAAQVSATAERLAATPPTAPGTDIVSALIAGRELCGRSACQMVVATDLEDSRLAGSGSPAALARRVAPGMPSFAGVPVTFVGLGASGAPAPAVSRAQAFFNDLMSDLGTMPYITRNL